MPTSLNSIRLETADGIATVWLGFSGTPVNGMSLARLAELDRTLAPVLRCPHLDAVVLRSTLPAGFCGGWATDPRHAFATEEDATEFAVVGQQVTNRLAAATPVTVAMLEGPCRGPGLELALACDLRLGVAEPDSAIGFLDDAADFPPCWGGTTRLPRLVGRRTAAKLRAGTVVNAREAQRIGLVDLASCRRRAKIELRTWLDRIQRKFRKPNRSQADPEGLALERIAFRRAIRDANWTGRISEPQPTPRTEELVPLPPDPVGLLGACEQTAWLTTEMSLRGRGVIAVGLSESSLSREFAIVVEAGRATPLEAEQARRRVSHSSDPAMLFAARLVIAADDERFPAKHWEPHLLPGTVFAVPSHELEAISASAKRPGRIVGLEMNPHRMMVLSGRRTRSEIANTVVGWLSAFGVRANLRRKVDVPSVRAAA